MRKSLLLAILILGSFWSCNQGNSNSSDKDQPGQSKTDSPSPKSKLGKMEADVMDLHEKSMNNMDTIMSLKKDLKQMAGRKDLSKADNDSIDANLHRLQKSYDDMMDWMNNYNEPDKMMSEDKAEAYMTDQLGKISAVDGEMQRSMMQARTFLKGKK